VILLDLSYKPQSWKAPKVTKSGTYNLMCKEKKDVMLLIRSQYCGEILKEPVSAVFKFYFKPPKSVPQKKMHLYYENEVPCIKKIDCTNMQKFLEDCLQGIIIENDSQVVEISSQKLWGSRDHMLIKIERVHRKDAEM